MEKKSKFNLILKLISFMFFNIQMFKIQKLVSTLISLIFFELQGFGTGMSK